MFNASLHTALLASALLGLAACDGGGEGALDAAASAPAGGASLAGSGPAATAHRLTAWVTPHWTRVPIKIENNSDGSEALVVSDPLFGSQRVAIRSRDAQGNITALDSDGPFSAIVSELGNRVGIICSTDVYKTHGTLPYTYESGLYLYLAEDLVEVEHLELLGRKFRKYQNCVHQGIFSLDTEGMGVNLQYRSQPPDEKMLEIFALQGRRHGFCELPVDRAKAYRYTANGTGTYVIAGLEESKEEISPATARGQSAYVAISQQLASGTVSLRRAQRESAPFFLPASYFLA